MSLKTNFEKHGSHEEVLKENVLMNELNLQKKTTLFQEQMRSATKKLKN